MSKQELLLTHLNKGKTFTAKQIKSSFGIAHPASTIRNLREQGYCVYSNPAVVNGAEVVKYRKPLCWFFCIYSYSLIK